MWKAPSELGSFEAWPQQSSSIKTAQLGDAFFINIRFHVRENWFYEMVNGYTRVFNVPAPKNTTEGASTSLESPRREGVGMEIMCGARTKVYLADLTDK